MIIHIVIFQFYETNKKANIIKAKNMLENLVGVVPTLKDIDVGINFSPEDRAMDLSIITKFNSKEGLNAYAIHPKHIEVVNFIKTVVEYSKVVDYETI